MKLLGRLLTVEPFRMAVPVKLFQGPMVLVKLFSTFRYHGAVPVKLFGAFPDGETFQFLGF